MSWKLIDEKELSKAVSVLKGDFVTRDVSDQPALRGAHVALASHSHWHAFVGRALSVHHVRLGIAISGGRTDRGVHWRRVGAKSGG